MEAMKGKKSVASSAPRRRRRPPRGHPRDPQHRVRLRRRHGFVGHGRLGAPQEDPGRRSPRGDRGQQGDLQPRATTSTWWSPTRTSPIGPVRGRRPPCTSRSTTSWAARGTTRSSRWSSRTTRPPEHDQSPRARPSAVRRAGPVIRQRHGLWSDEPDPDEQRDADERRTEPGVHRPRRQANDGRAITEAGRLLVASGAVDEAYVDAMHERETSVSTFMGNGLAIPHGTNEAKALIRQIGDLLRPLRRAASTGRAARRSTSSASPAPATTTSRCSSARRCSPTTQLARLDAATRPTTCSPSSRGERQTHT